MKRMRWMESGGREVEVEGSIRVVILFICFCIVG